MNELRGSFNAESKALFDEHVKGRNIMTPEVLRYGVSGKYAYELSTGTDFKHAPIFGVTVLVRRNGEHRHDLSKMFYDASEAETWIRTIGGF